MDDPGFTSSQAPALSTDQLAERVMQLDSQRPYWVAVPRVDTPETDTLSALFPHEDRQPAPAPARWQRGVGFAGRAAKIQSSPVPARDPQLIQLQMWQATNPAYPQYTPQPQCAPQPKQLRQPQSTPHAQIALQPAATHASGAAIAGVTPAHAALTEGVHASGFGPRRGAAAARTERYHLSDRTPPPHPPPPVQLPASNKPAAMHRAWFPHWKQGRPLLGAAPQSLSNATAQQQPELQLQSDHHLDGTRQLCVAAAAVLRSGSATAAGGPSRVDGEPSCSPKAPVPASILPITADLGMDGVLVRHTPVVVQDQGRASHHGPTIDAGADDDMLEQLIGELTGASVTTVGGTQAGLSAAGVPVPSGAMPSESSESAPQHVPSAPSSPIDDAATATSASAVAVVGAMAAAPLHHSVAVQPPHSRAVPRPYRPAFHSRIHSGTSSAKSQLNQTAPPKPPIESNKVNTVCVSGESCHEPGMTCSACPKKHVGQNTSDVESVTNPDSVVGPAACVTSVTSHTAVEPSHVVESLSCAASPLKGSGEGAMPFSGEATTSQVGQWVANHAPPALFAGLPAGPLSDASQTRSDSAGCTIPGNPSTLAEGKHRGSGLIDSHSVSTAPPALQPPMQLELPLPLAAVTSTAAARTGSAAAAMYALPAGRARGRCAGTRGRQMVAGDSDSSSVCSWDEPQFKPDRWEQFASSGKLVWGVLNLAMT